MIEFIDKTSEQEGTPLNRENMMALQGFIPSMVEFSKDENGNIVSVTEHNNTGTKTTTFSGDTITEIFVGEKTIVKTITFDEDGNIYEVIS